MIGERMISKKMLRNKTIWGNMTCDKYENALLLAAASNSEPDAKLAQHLDHCSTCRVTLREKKELFTRIDSALCAQMDGNPSPGFLPRLRLKLSQEPRTRPASNHVWHAAAAALALVVIAMFYPLVNTLQSGVQSIVQRGSQTPANSVLASVRAPRSADASEDLRVGENFDVRPSGRSSHSLAQSGPAEAEVLVPPDEQKALEQFVARVAKRDARAEAVVTPAADNPVARVTELPRVAPVDMAALQFHGAEQNGLEQSEWMVETGESE